MPATERKEFVRVGSTDVEAFVRERLQKPDRDRPLVVISVARGTPNYLIPPSEAAARLNELAEVVTLTDGDAGWELSKLVGGRLSCYWGAVRLYWPGFDSRASKAYEHPVWLARRIQTLGAGSAIDDIVKLVSERRRSAPGEQIRESVDERIAKLEGARAEVNGQREAAERERDAAASRATEAERDRDQLRERLATRTQERDRVRAASEEANRRVAGLEQEREEAREQRMAAERRRDEAEQERAALSARVRETEGRVATAGAPWPMPLTGGPPFSIRTDLQLRGREAVTDLFQKEVNRLSAELQEARSERDEDREKERDARRGADDERERLESQNRVANQKRGEAVEAREDADERLAEANEQFAALRTELDGGPRSGTSNAEVEALKRERQEWEDHAQNLEDSLSEVERDRDRLEREAASLKALLPGEAHADSVDVASEEIEILGVADAIGYAEPLPHIRFLKSAYGAKGADLYENPRAVYDSFVALERCAKLRSEGEIGSRLEDWFKERGVNYVAKESQTTRAKRWFLDDAKNEQALFEEHLRFGTGRDPRHCLRVQMAWDSEAGEWVIAHVGEHLDNTKTS